MGRHLTPWNVVGFGGENPKLWVGTKHSIIHTCLSPDCKKIVFNIDDMLCIYLFHGSVDVRAMRIRDFDVLASLWVHLHILWCHSTAAPSISIIKPITHNIEVVEDSTAVGPAGRDRRCAQRAPAAWCEFEGFDRVVGYLSTIHLITWKIIRGVTAVNVKITVVKQHPVSVSAACASENS